MAEIRIPLFFNRDSYWIAKESLFGGKSIALVINRIFQPNSYRCKDASEYNYLIGQLRSLASFLNSSNVSDCISQYEIDIYNSEEFEDFRYALN